MMAVQKILVSVLGFVLLLLSGAKGGAVEAPAGAARKTQVEVGASYWLKQYTAIVEPELQKLVSSMYPDLEAWSPLEQNQVAWNRLAQSPRLLQELELSLEDVELLRSSQFEFTPEGWAKLESKIESAKLRAVHELFKKLELSRSAPRSKTLILTIESIKAWIALNVAMFSVGMVASGVVPHDSSLGTTLLPLSVLSTLYLLTRAIAIFTKFSKQEIELMKWQRLAAEASKSTALAGLAPDLFVLKLIEAKRDIALGRLRDVRGAARGDLDGAFDSASWGTSTTSSTCADLAFF